jgi:hypothetical protein
MKKIIVALAAVAAFTLAFLAPHPSTAGVGICDPQQSVLCQGLVEWWNFEEPTDSTRFGSYRNSALLEEPAQNVGQSATHRLGSYAAGNFDTNAAHFRIPRYGSGQFTSYFTVASWVYLSTGGSYGTVVAATEGLGGITTNGLYVRINSSNKPEFVVYENETDTGQTYNTYPTALVTGNWYLVVWKLSPFGPYGKAQVCISATKVGDSLSAFSCGDLTYNVRSNAADLSVGGRENGERFKGYIDGVGIWARAWSPADLALYWNSGNGRAFPFY